MVDARSEVNLGGFERVIGRKVDGEEEDAPRVWALALFFKVSSLSRYASSAQVRGGI